MNTVLPYPEDFSGKTVVITGAGGVICSVMAKAFAEAGAKVAALGRHKENIEKLAEKISTEGFRCKAYQADVLDSRALSDAHSRILRDFGPCDILINGAGGNHPQATADIEYHHEKDSRKECRTFFDLAPDAIDAVFRLNFQGTLLAVQAFAPDMVSQGNGCILNISSMNAYVPLTKIPAYSGAKAAVSNFTQWLATYFAGSGVRCNAIAPGFLLTNQNRSLLLDADGNPTARSRKILEGTPMRRFVKSEELLGGTFFLCDDRASSAVTGVILPIDCGFLAYSGV